MKCPVPVLLVGWYLAIAGTFVLVVSVSQVGTAAFERALAASPLPAPLYHTFLFGGTIVCTLCGVGILYGESLARTAYVVWSILGAGVALATGTEPASLVVALVVFLVCVGLLYLPVSNRYFGCMPAPESTPDLQAPGGRYVQVVGRSCAACAQRIADASAAAPCARCASPLHRACSAETTRHVCGVCAAETRA